MVLCIRNRSAGAACGNERAAGQGGFAQAGVFVELGLTLTPVRQQVYLRVTHRV